ncbi:aspartate/glutamate racemase family protein [Streptomyces sp. CNQ085]|uniref:aspartate/glutamate racemase family protein n=1 Tax=Streptomyces sp. CNQ085 TaxID=2886944 RepID=UPI002674BD5A|nr:amino acid racemase [Streptomyces sp. CNQ085]MCI0384717.1 amino acid racemase [Streptomyces sp. CNQ085]
MTDPVPVPGGTLGVLGGMGPAATAEFLRLLAARVPADNDQNHPRIVMLSDPSVPDRSAALTEGGESPLPAIREGLATLVRWGADLLAVPCNTAHAYIDSIGELPVPVVHIVDATLRAAMARSPGGGWLAATAGTVESGLYQRRAAELGYRLVLPGAAVQATIHRVAVLVKAGRTVEAGPPLAAALHTLWHRAPLPVLTACTELPLAYTAAKLPPEAEVSSLDALASACADALYPVRLPRRTARPGAAREPVSAPLGRRAAPLPLRPAGY